MISIIIPTLNEEKVIAKTLSQIKSKLTIPYEIIISDGGSRDKTIEIAGKFADKVLVHASGKKQTIAEGRNIGAENAAGEFLVFFDADCSIENQDAFFKQALSNFENKKVVALTAYLRVLKEGETWADYLGYGFLNLNARIWNNAFHTGEAAGEFQMMRKEIFEKVGGFRGDLVTREDGDMFKRLSKIGETRSDPKLIVYHTGRRAHKEGWPNLLWTWTINTIWFSLFDKSIATKWKEVR